MATPEILEVGNNNVVDDDEEFSDGFFNGHLFYYDTNCQLPQPLTCKSIYTFLQEHLSNSRHSDRWNAGFNFGWTAALSENDPDRFFTSMTLPEAELAALMARM